MDAFYDLPELQRLPDGEPLSIERAQALLRAIDNNRDFTLVARLGSGDATARVTEALIVDVETDAIPPYNATGIGYRERLALRIAADAGKLVEVLALRRDFPILPHQNQTVGDAPASLCLYFEPAKAASRTWTPQRFLRRIQWWLEKSATGDLHATDQPVEQLFFVSPYELVLPWNFDEISIQVGQRFVVCKQDERPDGGFTCFLRTAPNDMDVKARTAAHLQFTMPTIIQGRVEREPQTLGDLHETLTRRGVDLLAPLRTELQQRVGSGIDKRQDYTATVLLLETPVARREGADPECYVAR